MCAQLCDFLQPRAHSSDSEEVLLSPFVGMLRGPLLGAPSLSAKYHYTYKYKYIYTYTYIYIYIYIYRHATMPSSQPPSSLIVLFHCARGSLSAGAHTSASSCSWRGPLEISSGNVRVQRGSRPRVPPIPGVQHKASDSDRGSLWRAA